MKKQLANNIKNRVDELSVNTKLKLVEKEDIKKAISSWQDLKDCFKAGYIQNRSHLELANEIQLLLTDYKPYILDINKFSLCKEQIVLLKIQEVCSKQEIKYSFKIQLIGLYVDYLKKHPDGLRKELEKITSCEFIGLINILTLPYSFELQAPELCKSGKLSSDQLDILKQVGISSYMLTDIINEMKSKLDSSEMRELKSYLQALLDKITDQIRTEQNKLLRLFKSFSSGFLSDEGAISIQLLEGKHPNNIGFLVDKISNFYEKIVIKNSLFSNDLLVVPKPYLFSELLKLDTVLNHSKLLKKVVTSYYKFDIYDFMYAKETFLEVVLGLDSRQSKCGVFKFAFGRHEKLMQVMLTLDFLRKENIRSLDQFNISYGKEFFKKQTPNKFLEKIFTVSKEELHIIEDSIVPILHCSRIKEYVDLIAFSDTFFGSNEDLKTKMKELHSHLHGSNKKWNIYVETLNRKSVEELSLLIKQTVFELEKYHDSTSVQLNFDDIKKCIIEFSVFINKSYISFEGIKDNQDVSFFMGILNSWLERHEIVDLLFDLTQDYYFNDSTGSILDAFVIASLPKLLSCEHSDKLDYIFDFCFTKSLSAQKDDPVERLVLNLFMNHYYFDEWLNEIKDSPNKEIYKKGMVYVSTKIYPNGIENQKKYLPEKLLSKSGALEHKNINKMTSIDLIKLSKNLQKLPSKLLVQSAKIEREGDDVFGYVYMSKLCLLNNVFNTFKMSSKDIEYQELVKAFSILDPSQLPFKSNDFLKKICSNQKDTTSIIDFGENQKMMQVLLYVMFLVEKGVGTIQHLINATPEFYHETVESITVKLLKLDSKIELFKFKSFFSTIDSKKQEFFKRALELCKGEFSHNKRIIKEIINLLGIIQPLMTTVLSEHVSEKSIKNADEKMAELLKEEESKISSGKMSGKNKKKKKKKIKKNNDNGTAVSDQLSTSVKLQHEMARVINKAFKRYIIYKKQNQNGHKINTIIRKYLAKLQFNRQYSSATLINTHTRGFLARTDKAQLMHAKMGYKSMAKRCDTLAKQVALLTKKLEHEKKSKSNYFESNNKKMLDLQKQNEQIQLQLNQSQQYSSSLYNENMHLSNQVHAYRSLGL